MDMLVTEGKYKYERYINEVLKADLESVCAELDRTNSDLADYQQLHQTILHMLSCKENGKTFKTMVDIGCNFFTQAHVDSFESILLNIGMGYFLEFELEAAAKFTKRKEELLSSRLKALRTKSAEIKAHIKMLLLYIGQLNGT